MKHEEFITMVAKETGVTQRDVRKIIQNISQNIIAITKDGEEVSIFGFGKFNFIEGTKFNYIDFTPGKRWRFKK